MRWRTQRPLQQSSFSFLVELLRVAFELLLCLFTREILENGLPESLAGGSQGRVPRLHGTARAIHVGSSNYHAEGPRAALGASATATTAMPPDAKNNARVSHD